MLYVYGQPYQTGGRVSEVQAWHSPIYNRACEKLSVYANLVFA